GASLQLASSLGRLQTGPTNHLVRKGPLARKVELESYSPPFSCPTPTRAGKRAMMPVTRTCRLLTLGCKVNQYETQYVKEALEASGYAEAAEGQPADLCVVNTCTVTAEGDAKSRQLIRRLHQHNPGAALVVMGCYATRDPKAVGRLPGVAKVVTDKAGVLDELRPFG